MQASLCPHLRMPYGALHAKCKDCSDFADMQSDPSLFLVCHIIFASFLHHFIAPDKDAKKGIIEG